MNSTILANGAAPKRRKMPAQKPGKSKQNYATPDDFIAAVEKRFGKIVFDLAAEPDNFVGCNPGGPGVAYFTKEIDSLKQDWAEKHREVSDGDGWLWLNPEFADMAPWAEKCALEMRKGARILLLTPAAVGSNWFHDHVRPSAHVIELRDRITFKGEEHGYPKDLLLSVFFAGLTGRSSWKWKQGFPGGKRSV